MSLLIDSLVRVSRVNGRDLKSDRFQRDGNERAIEGHRYRLGRHVEALNVSGGLVASGDQWQAALERVRRGRSAGVAVNYIDRLSRDVATGLAWVDELGKAGGVLISGGRVINLANPHERFMLIGELNNGELQLNIYKEKSRETMADVKQRGILNRLPFGYRRNHGEIEDADPKMLLIDDKQAPTVELIFEMRAAGSGWQAIVDRLHDLGVRSPKGAPYWTPSSLTSMVKNRVYRGEVTMGGHVTRRAHQPIVSEELWQAAQSNKRRIRTGKNVGGVAHGLVFCSGCGLPLQVQRNGTSDRLFYGCRRRSSGGPCPAPVNGVCDKIDTYVDELTATLIDGEALGVVNAQRDIDKLERTAREAQANYKAFFDGVKGMSSQEIRETLQALEAERDDALSAYEEARDAQDDSDLPESGPDYLSRPLVERRRIAHRLIPRLVLRPFPKGAGKRGANPADRLSPE